MSNGMSIKCAHCGRGLREQEVCKCKEIIMQQPSIGRIVHYVSYGTPGGEYKKECRAAIVTEVVTGEEAESNRRVGLAVLNPSGMFFHAANYDEWDGTQALEGAGAQGGSWHWPERV